MPNFVSSLGSIMSSVKYDTALNGPYRQAVGYDYNKNIFTPTRKKNVDDQNF